PVHRASAGGIAPSFRAGRRTPRTPPAHTAKSRNRPGKFSRTRPARRGIISLSLMPALPPAVSHAPDQPTRPYPPPTPPRRRPAAARPDAPAPPRNPFPRPQASQAALVHLHLPVRRPEPARLVGSQARRSLGHPRPLQAHPHQRHRLPRR